MLYSGSYQTYAKASVLKRLCRMIWTERQDTSSNMRFRCLYKNSLCSCVPPKYKYHSPALGFGSKEGVYSGLRPHITLAFSDYRSYWGLAVQQTLTNCRRFFRAPHHLCGVSWGNSQFNMLTLLKHFITSRTLYALPFLKIGRTHSDDRGVFRR